MKTIDVDGAVKVTIEYPDGTTKVVEDKPKGFVPLTTSNAYTVDGSLGVYSTVSAYRLQADNCHETKEQAQWAADQLKLIYPVLRAGAQALKEFEQLDWKPESDERIHGLIYRKSVKDRWFVQSSINYTVGIAYFPTREIAERVAEILNTEGISP